MGLFEPLNILFGLSLAVLVAIYLFAGRQPKLTVPSLMLFDQIATQINKRRFRSDLFFWLEAATLSALSLAAAGLYLKLAPTQTHPRRWALIFDAGAAMGAREGSVERIALAKRQALAIVGGARAGDQFSVISYAVEAHDVLALTSDRLAVARAIESVRVDDTASRAAAFTAALSMARDADQIEVFAARLPPSAALAARAASAPVRFDRVGSQQDNLAIAALDPGRPLSEPGYCAVRSFAAHSVDCEVEIDLDGRPVERGRVTVAPYSQAVVSFGPLPAAGLLRAAILTDDALAADNVRYAYAASFSHRRVLILSAEPAVSDDLARIINAIGPGAAIRTADPTRPGSSDVRSEPVLGATPYDLLVTYDMPAMHVPAAAILEIFPRSGSTFDVQGTAASSELDAVAGRGPLLAPVALGRARVLSVAEWMTATASGIAAPPLRSISLAALGRDGRGRVGVIAFDVSGHLLFDPDRLDALTLTIDMLKKLLAPVGIRIVATGARVSVPVRAPARLTAPDRSVMTLSPDREHRVSFRPLLTGHYLIESEGVVENVFANYFDASESNLTVAAQPTREWPRSHTQSVVADSERVRPLSAFLVGLALLAFLGETVLLAARPRRSNLAGN
jgi:hypothetical protein